MGFRKYVSMQRNVAIRPILSPSLPCNPVDWLLTNRQSRVVNSSNALVCTCFHLTGHLLAAALVRLREGGERLVQPPEVQALQGVLKVSAIKPY